MWTMFHSVDRTDSDITLRSHQTPLSFVFGAPMPIIPLEYSWKETKDRESEFRRGCPMLQATDLDAFIRLVEQAERETGPIPGRSPDATLRAEGNPDGLLHRAECARIWKSLRTACATGDFPERYCRIFETIVRDLTAEIRCYLPLAHCEQWLGAVRWAMSQPPSPSDNLRSRGMDRQFHVGGACRRLRECGYSIPIHTFGPHLDDDTRAEIARRVDNLIAQAGGVDAIHRLFRTMRETGKLHNGMWLFGNIPGGGRRVPRPAVPFGWLLSVALRNIQEPVSTNAPEASWQSAVDIATDFAASMDCQRYNPYEGLSVEAPDFLFSLAESLTWRELFTLPQVPPTALPTLRAAFLQIEWPDGVTDLAAEVDGLFAEIDRLVTSLCVGDITEVSASAAQSSFPLLWRHARAAPGVANAGFLDPFGKHPRNQDRFVFFQISANKVIVLPPSLAAAAACEAIFRLIWKQPKDLAARIVGDTMEKSVAVACRRHAAPIWEKARYRADRKDLEIDVAVREGQEITVFETKAKSLTSAARTGDMLKFLDDYSNSFLALLQQLVRHERHVKRGCTPLTRPDDDLGALRVTKIAVSPLSFGPASDQVLSNALMNAIAQARLVSAAEDPEHTAILDRFNTAIQACMNDIADIAPRPDGPVDLGHYMMRVSWTDLGQVLYCLDRGRSVVDGTGVLMHLTFSTRDFWTDIAFAERNGLGERNLYPLLPGAPAPD